MQYSELWNASMIFSPQWSKRGEKSQNETKRLMLQYFTYLGIFLLFLTTVFFVT